MDPLGGGGGGGVSELTSLRWTIPETGGKHLITLSAHKLFLIIAL